MDIQKLKTALQKATARGHVALIGHDAPDVDSVVSCVLMAALCAAWQIPAEIILPTQADEQTRRVMPKFGVHPGRADEADAPGRSACAAGPPSGAA